MTRWPWIPGLALAIALGLLWGHQHPSNGWVWILGCAIGWLLVRGRFGFSGPIRRLIQGGDAEALAPMVVLLILLILGSGLVFLVAEPLGINLRPSRAPLSTSLAVGAFLFGIGMQMARRCASGTLASAAQANGPFAATLLGLMAGVFLGSLHRPWLEALIPGGRPAVSLQDRLPLALALLVQLGLLWLGWGAVLAFCRLRGQQRSPDPRPPQEVETSRPSMATVVGLSLLLLLLFGVGGEPWKVLWGLGLAAAQGAKLLGWDPQSSDFWATPSRLALLSGPGVWLQQGSVVVNLGVIYGAVLAGSTQWSRGAQSLMRTTPGLLLRHGIGGLLMGYGGFLSYGCNISSFLGGVMSLSLHGWLWILAAVAGSGCWLRWEQRLGAKTDGRPS